MRNAMRYRPASLFLCLSVFAACQDEPLSPRAYPPELQPGFALGPGAEIWVLEDMSALLGNSAAYSINKAKEITGWRSTSASARVAYVWAPPGTATTLGTLSQAPYDGFGYDINNAGQVVGSASNKAVRWDPDSLPVQLSLPSGFTGKSGAVEINELGYAVGNLYGSIVSQPVVWYGGQYEFLNLPEGYCCVTGAAEDINDGGPTSAEIVGMTEDVRPFYHRASSGDPMYVELALMQGSTSGVAKAINNAGVIVGQSGGKAVRWPGYLAQPEYLGALSKGGWSVANDINEIGYIAGMSEDGAGASMPFRLKPGGYLTKLPVPKGATGGEAIALNDQGHIVGFATFGPGVKHAVVWWRVVGKQILRASSIAPASINLAAPGLIHITLLSDASLDVQRLEPSTLTLGNGVDADVSVAKSNTGGLAVSYRDVNDDGRTDLTASFDGQAVLSDEIRKGAEIAELMVMGMVKDRSNAAYSPVTVKLVSK